MKHVFWLAVGVLSLVWAGQARALTCELTGSSFGLDFGEIGAFAANELSVAGTIKLGCKQAPLPLKVCLHVGVGANGTSVTARAMAAGTEKLAYELYTSREFTTVFDVVSVNALPFFGTYAGEWNIVARIPGGSRSGLTILNNADTLYSDSYSSVAQAKVTVTSSPTPLLLNCRTLAPEVTLAMPLTVKATLQKSCVFPDQTPDTLSFGSIGLLREPVHAQSLLDFRCTKGTAYSIALNGGLFGDGSATGRKMVNFFDPTQSLSYQLYMDSNRSMVWGSAEGQVLKGEGGGEIRQLTIYGTVPVQATPVPGTYIDRVTATVTF